jgi:hypothetical protein
MGTIKVAVLEVDGVELDVPTEYDLTSALTHIGFSSGTGGPDNFSYNNVPASTIVTIPINQQMIVKKRIRVEGTLIIRGQLCLI